MSANKRKTAKGMETRSKRSKQSAEANPEGSNRAAIDVASLTAEVTKNVTNTVLESLRQAGLLPNLQNTVPSANNNTTGNTIRSETISNSQTVGTETSGLAAINTSITTSPAPSSSCKLDKSRFISSRVPLHSTVPQKKKEKIWSNEYIDLSTLQDDDVEDISFNIHTGAISSSSAPKRKFLSIEQWTDAFNVYASVRRVKYPEEADGLAAYMSLVRRIADEKGCWFYYDSNFRRLRQNTNYAWDEIENELFLIALSRKQPFRAQRQSDQTKQPSSGTKQTNYRSCYKYNKGVACNGCRYPHICSECGRPNHAQYRCWNKKGSKQEDTNTPSTNKPASGGSQQTCTNTK